jgi:hypothetical protein
MCYFAKYSCHLLTISSDIKVHYCTLCVFGLSDTINIAVSGLFFPLGFFVSCLAAFSVSGFVL